MMNISKIINDKNMKNLPSQLNKTEQISPVYTLKQYDIRYLTMKNLKDIRTNNILDNMINLPCNCTASPFKDPNYGE